MTDMKRYVDDAISLLQRLIAIPRVSRDEAQAASVLMEQMMEW